MSALVPEPRYIARLHTTLETVEPVWRSLAETGRLTAYQDFDWVRGLVDALGAKAELAIIEVAADGAPAMIFPLLRPRRSGLTFVEPIDFGLCDYNAPLIAAGLQLDTSHMAAIWSAVTRALPRADVIQIPKIPATIDGEPNPLLQLRGVRRTDVQTFGMRLSGPSETVLERIARPSALKDLGIRRRRLARRGPVSFVRADTPALVDELMDVLVAQRHARFSAIGRFDLIARPEVAQAYRDAARRGLTGGSARLFGLMVGGEWVATIYGLVDRGAFHFLIPTMAGDEWKNCSPGLVATAETVVWAAEQDLRFFDFSIGAMSYKTDLGGVASPLYEYSRARSLRGAAFLAVSRTASRAKAAIRRNPELFARLREARRWLRRR